MADVKWSNNTSFPIQLGFGVGDYIMGLTAGNSNAKYPVSLITTKISGPASSTNNAIMIYDGTTGKLAKNSLVTIDDDGNIETPVSITANALNLPDENPTSLYVATSGDDDNNGQIIQPKLSVVTTDTAASIGQSVFIAPGTYSGGQFLKRVGVGLYGSSPQDCKFTSAGLLGIDNPQWIGATSPTFAIHDITLVGTGTSYYPSQYVNNSSQTFSNVKFPTNPFIGGRITNLNLINNCYFFGADIIGCENLNIISGICEGGFKVTNFDDFTSKIIIRDFDFKGYSLIFETGTVGNGSFEIEIFNCVNISSIEYMENSVGIESTLKIDANSTPISGIGTSGDLLTVTRTTNIATGVDTGSGFSIGKEFSWNAVSKVFCAGRFAHETNGSDNIILGKYSTSSFSGCLVISDSTVTNPSLNYFPHANNQAILNYAGGFGIGCNRTIGPKAGFHYGGQNGSDGKILLKASGAVIDGDISSSEINPYITTTSLIFKGKYSGGGIFSYDINALPGYALTGTTNTFTQLNTFNAPILIKEVQDPFVTNITPSAIMTTSGNITNIQLVTGCLVYTGSANGEHTLPTGSDIDLILQTPNMNRGLRIRFENQTDHVWRILPNTGMLFTGLNFGDALIIQSRGTLILDLVKNGTANYLLFGGYQGYSIIPVTGTTKTLDFTDMNSLQECTNAATQTLTVPLNSTTAFPIGTRIDLAQVGAGQVVISPAVGVTVNSKLGNLKLSSQYSGASLTKTAINTWLLVGDLAA